MKWIVRSIDMREFDKNFAIEGDMYWYHNGKLIFTANSMEVNRKQNLFTKIRVFFWRKRNGGVVKLNRRTLEYIYNVCKGVMPSSKEDFVNCVMGSIPQ